MTRRSDVDENLPLGDLAFQILLALGDGPSHGWAIGKEIEERTDGRLDPTTGALYQALKRLRDDRLIAPDAEATRESPDGRRRYFRLTERGREAVVAEARRLDDLLDVVRSKKLFEGAP